MLLTTTLLMGLVTTTLVADVDLGLAVLARRQQHLMGTTRGMALAILILGLPRPHFLGAELGRYHAIRRLDVHTCSRGSLGEELQRLRLHYLPRQARSHPSRE